MASVSTGQRIRRIDPASARRGVDPGELYAFRDLLRFLVLRDLRVLYKQTVLGFGWALVRPILSVVVFTFVFGRLADMPSDGVAYPLFALAALLPWTYLSDALTASAQSLVLHREMLPKVYFPRLFLPWTPVLTKLVDLALALTVLVVVLVPFGHPPGPRLAVIPLLVALLMATAGGLGMIFSALAVRYRDVQHGLPFVVQILFYAAPVVWPLSLLEDAFGPTARLAYGLYPAAGAIEGFRAVLLDTSPIPWDLLAIGASTAAVLFLVGLATFRRAERSFADVV